MIISLQKIKRLFKLYRSVKTAKKFTIYPSDIKNNCSNSKEPAVFSLTAQLFMWVMQRLSINLTLVQYQFKVQVQPAATEASELLNINEINIKV